MSNIWDYLNYDDKVGDLIWIKLDVPNQMKVGEVAGHIEKGYRRIQFRGFLYRSHRLIWEYFNGPIPKEMQIDHINGDKSDNRIENLRLATNSQNQHNRKLNSNSSSGVKGLRFMSGRRKPWQARIGFLKKRYCRYFQLEEEAISWLVDMRNELHGKFQNQGFNDG